MTNTYIVRRMDDLGRIVIPKEIRRTMNLKSGDPFEIYTTRDGCVCFKKYYPIDTQNWEKAFRVANLMLTTEFALLNYDGEVMEHNSQKEVYIDTSKLNKPIYLDGEIVGYLQALDDNCNEKRFAEVVKIIEEIFKNN